MGALQAPDLGATPNASIPIWRKQMPKLTDTETLVKFKEWLRHELSSPDTDYAFVIDQVGGALYQIQEFGETETGGISHKAMHKLMKKIKKKYKHD
jgi:hypothetical protein